MPEVTAVDLRVARADGSNSYWSVRPSTHNRLDLIVCEDNRHLSPKRIEEDKKFLQGNGFVVSDTPESPGVWHDDNVQFTRLLAEISYLGLDQTAKTALCESMDLEPAELESLLIRAEKAFERLKRQHLPEYTPDPDHDEPMLKVKYRCPDCGHEWQDEHTSACDATCPQCGVTNITALSYEESDGYLRVEYDLAYAGGDYSKTGDFAYIPYNLFSRMGMVEAFRQTTGHDPVHIIHYSPDEVYDKQGNLKDE